MKSEDRGELGGRREDKSRMFEVERAQGIACVGTRGRGEERV